MSARARHRGFTLIELLIGTVLLALLLTSMAIATHASLMAYEENTESAALTQTTRVLLARMRREIRTAASVDHDAPSNQLVIIPPENGTGLEQIAYEYTVGGNTLYYHRTIDGQVDTQVVFHTASAVQLTAFNCQYDVAQDGQGVFYTRRAVVTLSLAIDNQIRTATCSASPRRNQQY